MSTVAQITHILSPAALYVRESSGFREAWPQEIIQRADALICVRFRPGAPVLHTPNSWLPICVSTWLRARTPCSGSCIWMQTTG